MKKTAFTDILLNWETFSKSQKIMRAQEFESMMARMQGRKPRRIQTEAEKDVYENITKSVGRFPAAYYNRKDTKNLYLLKLDDTGLETLKNIVHEGFHAYVDDFLNSRVYSLKLGSKLNKEMFFLQEENLPTIAKEFHSREMMPLYDSFYIEERLNYLEDSIYISKLIIDSIDNLFEAMQMMQMFVLSLNFYAENENRGLDFERKFGVKYDDVVINALNGEITEKEDINKSGKILDSQDPEYLSFFTEVSGHFKQLSSALQNKMMNPQVKEQIQANALNNIMILYRDFVTKRLKTKRKN